MKYLHIKLEEFLTERGLSKREYVTIWILKGQTLTVITEMNSKE